MLGTADSVASARMPANLQGVGSVRLACLRCCQYMILLTRQAVSFVKYTKGLSRHQPDGCVFLATYIAIACSFLLCVIEASLLLAPSVWIDHRLNTVTISLPVTKRIRRPLVVHELGGCVCSASPGTPCPFLAAVQLHEYIVQKFGDWEGQRVVRR